MKTIYFIRHAKSSWDFPELSDAERPLVDSGINRTKKVAQFLMARDVKADIVISSHAVRAFETAKIVAEGIGYPVDRIRIEKLIYDENYEHVLGMIYALPNDLSSVMIFGHNPNLTQLTNLFVRPVIENLPTSGVSCFSFNTEKWDEISSCDPVTEFILFPKILR